MLLKSTILEMMNEETKMADYYKEFCSKCKYEEVNVHDSPCKECIDTFFDDWKNPKRKFGKYFERRIRNERMDTT